MLAPAYDLLCTAVYKDLSPKMAMKIGGKYLPEHVFIRHWQKLVPDTVAAKRNLERQLIKMGNDCLKKALMLKEGLATEGVKSSIFDDICDVISKRAMQIKL